MIIGVTHDSSGRVIQRLSVSTKIAIGLPPNGERNYPTKLDHFVFLRKKRTAKGVEWEPDSELTEHYGKDCRGIRVVLIDDDMENIFPTSYAWWMAVERKCWGDGASATRRTPEKPDGQPWMPCGNGCPDLASGQCKPSGDLRFVLADFPRLGSVCRIHTSSYRSIRQIHSALQEIQSFTWGRLAGLTAKLVVRPEEAAYFDAKDNRKKSTTIWALSLEVDGEDMQKLVSNLTENARVFAETRKLLGNGRVIEVVEDEEEQAPEVTAEFYPPASATAPRETSEAPSATVNASKAPETGDPQRSRPPAPPKSNPMPKPALREPQRKAAQTSGQESGPAVPANAIPHLPEGSVDGDPTNGHPSESQRIVSPAASSNNQPAKPPLQKPARQTAPADGHLSAAANPVKTASPQPAVTAPKPNGMVGSNDAQPKTSVVRGVIGPFEPDETGHTLRRNSRGVEYVVFKISQSGLDTTVYCNRTEMLPEIARRQGREASAQVTVSGSNGHTYCVLDHFAEG